MTRPRASLVSIADTPYYHCINRCVRRAFLCGQDPVSGVSFEHRRQWILERLELLTRTFAIDLCAYALMSNHYHLVLRIRTEQAQNWTPVEVAMRWKCLFHGPPWLDQFLSGMALSPECALELDKLIPLWTERLCSLSWFERCLNEHVARRANAEDGCTGRFWEGRFKSEALLDEPALLAAMVYVDLNPIRAGLAQSVMTSTYTSARQRALELTAPPLSGSPSQPLKNQLVALTAHTTDVPVECQGAEHTLPFELLDYLDLVDSSGRIFRNDQPGIIPSYEPRLLKRLGIPLEHWFSGISRAKRRQRSFFGSPRRLRQLAQARGWRWVKGVRVEDNASRRLNC